MADPSATADPARPTVVVVIPFYDGGRWVERALRSVFAQSTPADEVVVVNDGSRREEREVLRGLAERYPLTLIDKENGGQGSARNAGVAASKARYISFLDQDDFYTPDHIRDLVAALPENDARFGVVYGNFDVADGAGAITERNFLDRQPGLHPKRGSIAELIRHDLFILPSASLISRRAFEEVGGFDEQFTGYEDDDLFVRMFMAGYTNDFVDKPVVVWSMHADSTSRSVKMIRSRFLYFKKLIATFPDDDSTRRYDLAERLAPRFGPSFIFDAVKVVSDMPEHRAETLSILREYAGHILGNAHVSPRDKRKLRLLIFLVARFPRSLVRASIAASRLPVARRLALRFLVG